MTFDPQIAIAEIDRVLALGKVDRKPGDVVTRTARMKACILRWAHAGSPYREMAEKLDPYRSMGSMIDDRETNSRAILSALREDFAQGMVKTFEEMVHASMFDDLLGQAQSLLDEDYRLPAAVVAGATLESHLRELAGKHGVTMVEQKKNKTIPRTASALNDDMHAKAKAYSTTEFRQVQVWIDLRNEAAHGKPEFQNRTANDVGSMINGIREFMVRNPA